VNSVYTNDVLPLEMTFELYMNSIFTCVIQLVLVSVIPETKIFIIIYEDLLQEMMNIDSCNNIDASLTLDSKV